MGGWRGSACLDESWGASWEALRAIEGGWEGGEGGAVHLGALGEDGRWQWPADGNPRDVLEVHRGAERGCDGVLLVGPRADLDGGDPMSMIA